MNGLELLKRDHDTIMTLLDEASSYAEKKRALARIKNEIETHAYLEETLLYPILQEEAALKTLADDARAQHGLRQELLNDLDKQDGAEFEKNFQTLKAEAQLHFAGEENEIFSQIARLKSAPDLARLGARLESDKKAHQTSAGAPV